MELFGLILAVPFTLLTSTVFCLLALWAFRRFPMSQTPVAIVAGVILCSGALEFGLSLVIGPLALHQRFDGIHSTLHFTNFVLAPPAIACVIIVVALRRGIRPVPLRIFAICVCWFTCMASLLGNIVVDEAIYGIDGSRVPPTQSSPDSNPLNRTSPNQALQRTAAHVTAPASRRPTAQEPRRAPRSLSLGSLGD